jgi:hypothetical protein
MKKIIQSRKETVAFIFFSFSGFLHSQSIINIPDGGVYNIKKDSNEIILTSAVKLEWNIPRSLGFLSASNIGGSSNIRAATILTDGLSYHISQTTLPVKKELFKDLSSPEYKIITTLSGELLMLGTNSSSIFKFKGIPIMDPSSVVVAPYACGAYICALHRHQINQSNANGGYCSIINKNTGIVESDFPLPEFCNSQLVKNVQWINNRFVLCEKYLRSGIEFSIIDTLKKTAFDGNRMIVRGSYVNINAVVIGSSGIICSYRDPFLNVDKWIILQPSKFQ